MLLLAARHERPVSCAVRWRQHTRSFVPQHVDIGIDMSPHAYTETPLFRGVVSRGFTHPSHSAQTDFTAHRHTSCS